MIFSSLLFRWTWKIFLKSLIHVCLFIDMTLLFHHWNTHCCSDSFRVRFNMALISMMRFSMEFGESAIFNLWCHQRASSTCLIQNNIPFQKHYSIKITTVKRVHQQGDITHTNKWRNVIFYMDYTEIACFNLAQAKIFSNF